MKMELGLHHEHLTHDDPKRSYANLLSIIDRTIMRRREPSNLVQTQVGLRQMPEGKDLLAAPAKPAAPSPKGGQQSGRPDKGGGTPSDAAPVLPQSKAQAHAKTKAKPKPHEVPSEEVPAAEAGRPPDPPGGGIGDMEFGENDEREIDVEGEGAPSKIGTLKAEANTLADLCTHRYRNPYCESCIRAKMKHFRTKRGAFQRELKSWGDLITFDFLDMRRAADAGLGIDDGAREVLVVRDIATRVIAAIPTESRHTDQVVNALKRLFRIPKTQSQDGLQRRCA
eukprot:s2065_g6.t1